MTPTIVLGNTEWTLNGTKKAHNSGDLGYPWFRVCVNVSKKEAMFVIYQNGTHCAY